MEGGGGLIKTGCLLSGRLKKLRKPNRLINWVLIACTGNQQIENEASNQSNDQINEAGDEINNEPIYQIQEGNKIETLKENESGLNKNIEENWNSKHDQSENSSEISSGENYKATSYGTSKEQIIRQHKFYIHSSWLGVQSSYFRSLFSCGMRESSATEVHIQILAMTIT